jgi:predicted MPP superfamily phosphohydrolase
VRFSPVWAYLVLGVVVHAAAARWGLRSFPALARHRRALFAGCAVLALLPTATRLVTWWMRTPLTAAFFALTTFEVVGVGIAMLLAALLGALFGFGTWGAARLKRARPSPPSPPPPPSHGEAIGRREAVERVVGVAALAAGGVTLGWGTVRGRHAFALEEVVLRVRGWPRALEGYTIAQVSDVHMGTFVGERELAEGFELVRRAKADLLVATGDLVDYVAAAVDPLAARLAAAAPRDGVLAILGNHDHYAGPELVARRLRAAGIRVLCNEGLLVRPDDGGGFALLGVDDHQGAPRPEGAWVGPDLDRALAMVPRERSRILLAHQPVFLDESAGRVDVQLSGHTHGGQINPGFRPAAMLTRYVAGRYEAGGTTLWVNRGFGTVGPPSRVACPPEVTKLVIVAA